MLPYWQVNHDLGPGVIFLHVPRTGGTSIMRGMGACHCQHNEFPGGHPTQTELRSTHAKWWGRHAKIAWVRNPFTRLISIYRFTMDWTEDMGRIDARSADYDLLVGGDFDDCLKLLISGKLGQVLWRPQSHFITDPAAFDFIGRFERMEEDWQKLCDLLGADLLLPNLNASTPIAEPESYYSPFACAAVEHLYRQDYRTFHYRLPVPYLTEPLPAPLPSSEPRPSPAITPKPAPCSGCGQKIPAPPPIALVEPVGGIMAPAALDLTGRQQS